MFDDSIPPLLLARQAALVGGDRQLRRMHDRHELVRVRPGVYVTADAWRPLSYDDRYRLLVHATAAISHPGTQFSHDSAAALWHLPGIGPWPKTAHALSPAAATNLSSSGLRRHAIGLDDFPDIINLASVTSLARTVVDCARSMSFIRAVCIADAALAEPEKGSFRAKLDVHPVTGIQLAQLAAALAPTASGLVKLRAVMAFARAASGSPGESVSRVQFHLMGYPPPELQVPFYDDDGFIGFADFYWPELDLIGEFDGLVKYLGETYRRGKLPEEVVLAEKIREDRMRRVARAFARWDWGVALDKRLLAGRLRPYGLISIR